MSPKAESPKPGPHRLLVQGPLIVACATPWGRSALAVLRLSGEGLRERLATFCAPARGAFPPPRHARLFRFFDARGVIDEGLLTFFPGPRSYTGEDLAELSCHGNPLIVERLLAAAQTAGARLAAPGEFTRRAFLNGRMDLTRAEAVAQLIHADTDEGLALARAGLDGAVEALIRSLSEQLALICAELEARLDFPGEDLITAEDEALRLGLRAITEQAEAEAARCRVGQVLLEGAEVVLLGPVNAGKSSLFNALIGEARALVSAEPGTTRDMIERRVALGGVPVRLMDTAGLRDEAGAIEAEGMALGQRAAAAADLVLVVIPAHQPELAEQALRATEGRPRLLVGNHADRPGAVRELAGQALIMTNARSGEGVPALAQAIPAALLGEAPGAARTILGSARQRDGLLAAAACARGALSALEQQAGFAVAAEELYEGIAHLDALSGRDTRELVLDRLFERFCIGK